MKFPLTFTGQLKFHSSAGNFVVSEFLRSLLVDLEMGKSNRVLRSFSIRNNSIRFSATPISTRLLKYPFGALSLLFHPNHYKQFVLSIASLSHGELLVEQNEDSIFVIYTLNFSETFRWALFVFTGSSLFGLTALAWETRFEIFFIGFCVLALMSFGFDYGFGVISSIMQFRRYLKNRMLEIIT